jgi:hypothetical protein
MTEDTQRGVRDVIRSLENIEAVALEGHGSLDSLQAWAISTMHYLEHEAEYAELELESAGLASDIVEVMVLIHTLYRRITEPAGLAAVPPWLLDEQADAENEPRD